MREHTYSKWVARFRVDVVAGLLDRSSAPKSIPHRTPDELVEVIVALRRPRMTSAEIAFCLAMAPPTVSAVLARVGLGKLSRLKPAEPPNRYERRHPGELVHVDVRSSDGSPPAAPGTASTASVACSTNRASAARRPSAGSSCSVRRDATRLAYVEGVADEKVTTAVGFLHRAIAFYHRHGITVQRVTSDNSAWYHDPCLRLPHTRPAAPAHPPDRPRTNGKTCVLASGCRPAGRRGSPRPAV